MKKTISMFFLVFAFLIYFQSKSLAETERDYESLMKALINADIKKESETKNFISVEDISSGKEKDGIRFLYNYLLEREPDPEGYREWKEALESGKFTWEQVVFGFIKSEEFMNKAAESNTLFVRGLYMELLMRGVDESGEAYYTGGLDNGTFTREQVRSMIINSPEYRERGTGAGNSTRASSSSAATVTDAVPAGVPPDAAARVLAFMERCHFVPELKKLAAYNVEVATRYGMDWRMFPVAAVAESSGGRENFRPFNCVGMGRKTYRSYEECIEDYYRTIASYGFGQDARRIFLRYNCNKEIYANNCIAWMNTI